MILVTALCSGKEGNKKSLETVVKRRKQFQKGEITGVTERVKIRLGKLAGEWRSKVHGYLIVVILTLMVE